MFSTLNRYFSRELALTFVAVSAILLAVVVSKSFVSLLTRVMEGKMSADAVLSLLGLGILEAAILLAPFALFISVMLVMGRLYRDSEIYAIKANGIGQLRLFRYAALFVLPVIVLLGYASVFLTPQIAQQVETIKLKAKERTSVLGLVPGQFIEARQGDWVVFVESADRESGTARNIFIYDRRGDRISIETARSVQQTDSQELEGRTLVLSQGRRYEGIPGEGNFTVLSFDHHNVRIPELNAAPDDDDPETHDGGATARRARKPRTGRVSMAAVDPGGGPAAGAAGLSAERGSPAPGKICQARPGYRHIPDLFQPDDPGRNLGRE